MKLNTSEIFAQIGQRLQSDPGKVQGESATFRFQLDGEDGGTFYVQIDHGKVRTGQGEPTGAQCSIRMSAADFKAMAAGQLNPVTAFMGGKLKVNGDIALALKLQSLLK